MKIIQEQMFRSDGSCVQLHDMLNHLQSNTLIWSILDFYGIGIAPSDLSMEEFEEMIRASSTGYPMDWSQLLHFAQGLEQTFDCLIVGVQSHADLDGDKFAADDFSDCTIVIQAFDSTEWEMRID